MRTLAQAKSRYQTAISETEAAREGLSDEAALISWLDSGAGVAAANDPLGGRYGSDASGRAPMSFARVLEELRADAEAIAQSDPRTPVALPPHGSGCGSRRFTATGTPASGGLDWRPAHADRAPAAGARRQPLRGDARGSDDLLSKVSRQR